MLIRLMRRRVACFPVTKNDTRKGIVMKLLTRIGLLALATGLGVMAVIGVTAALLTTVGSSAVAATAQVDFTLDMMAPSHIATGSAYEVRIGYYNFGTQLAPDAWVTATLPVGTQLVTATDRWGEPLPPDAIDGNSFSWYFVEPLCEMPLDACCGHVLLTLQADETLPEGEILTTTAAITSSAPESDTTNNTASVASVVCDMAGSTKQVHMGHAMPGDVLTYTINVNLAQQAGGGANGRWVTVTDTLPFSHQVRFLGWAGTLTGTQIDGHHVNHQRTWAGAHVARVGYALKQRAVNAGRWRAMRVCVPGRTERHEQRDEDDQPYA